MPIKRVLSLFSGCGGMDLGFEGGFEALQEAINETMNRDWIEQQTREGWIKLKKLSYNTVFANDINLAAQKLWVTYFSKFGYNNDIYKTNSIVDLVKNHKSKRKNIFPKNIDIVTGGFPCQDFSVAGKRQGFNSRKNHNGHYMSVNDPTIESRGQLYIWMKEVIEITKPKLFIAENVKGLVNLLNVKEFIQHDFAKSVGNGYLVVNPRVLYAPDYGIPQTRERVIFIGFRKNALKKEAFEALLSEEIPFEYDPYPPKTHTNLKEYEETQSNIRIRDVLKPYVFSRIALKGLIEPDIEKKDLSQKLYSKAKYMGSHCQGQKEIDLNKPSFTIRSEHHGNIEFRRLSKEHGGTHKKELSHGYKERRLSVRECARLQTFPDDFEFVIKNINQNSFYVNSSEAYKVIGNAVPPLLAYHIAKRLEMIWDNLFIGE